MLRTVSIALLLAAAGTVLAQDAASSRATGTVLADAMPPQADIVVHAPDLRGLFDAAAAAGLGDAASWRAAFDTQLKAWGGERLTKGGGALLDAADGEAALASIELKLPGAGGSIRSTLFAMRSSADEKTLRAAVMELLQGVRPHYEGEPREEEIGGRRVITFPGNERELHVLVQPGLVVACDHALALGLFFRGLAGKDAAPFPARRPAAGPSRLTVRYGRGEAAWEGSLWGEGEAVSWRAKAPPKVALFGTADSKTAVCTIRWDRAEDMPLLPRPVTPADLKGLGEFVDAARELDAKSAVQTLGYDKSGMTVGMTPFGDFMGPSAGTSNGPGGAWRLGWLRALWQGRLPMPWPAMDAALLHGPFDAAVKAAKGTDGQFVAWKAPDQPGELRGPMGHGPATFLTLRALHDIGHGIAPGAAEAAKPPVPQRPQTPLPPPTEPKDK